MAGKKAPFPISATTTDRSNIDRPTDDAPTPTQPFFDGEWIELRCTNLNSHAPP
jgi:hypothetical protein